MSSTLDFPQPRRGASLMLAFRMEHKVTLVIGSNVLAASRALSALEADSSVIVIARGGIDAACEELKWRAGRHELQVLDLDSFGAPSQSAGDTDASALQSFLESQPLISLVCITDTLLGPDPNKRRTRASAVQFRNVCCNRNIPVNVTDMPDLCDFTFPATHRFSDPLRGDGTPLQVAVTTNGRGCRLSGRIKRDIIAHLPKEAGVAVEKIGRMRDLAKSTGGDGVDEIDLNEELTVSSPNRPVPQRTRGESELERTRRRMKWVAQISEYWSFSQLAKLTDDEMANALKDSVILPAVNVTLTNHTHSTCGSQGGPSQHSLILLPPKRIGRILLVGSGPGHPSLLTLATHSALTQQADLVLTDKLVPAAVLALIPKHVEVRVARKFPGNAEGAQQEMMEAAVEAANAGKTVVRLKQGDPMLYGRAGEEVLYFRERGLHATVVPGVSSALAAPLFAGIPVTQRGVAESFTVCTGVGRQGRDVRLPGYERARTLVVLMGVARLPQMLSALLAPDPDAGERRKGPSYPPHTPIALVERASMPDQRVITSTLQHISKALDSTGEQRPPGLLVVGWAVLALWGGGDVNVLDGVDDVVADERRVEKWLDGMRWRVSEGIDPCWDSFQVTRV